MLQIIKIYNDLEQKICKIIIVRKPLNKPFLPLVVSRGYGLSANKPMAITPQIPLAPITDAIVFIITINIKVYYKIT